MKQSKYTNHEHQWRCMVDGKAMFIMGCDVCGLEVWGMADHVSLFDYAGKGQLKMLGILAYPDPEDEEETQLEPEELQEEEEEVEV